MILRYFLVHTFSIYYVPEMRNSSVGCTKKEDTEKPELGNIVLVDLFCHVCIDSWLKKCKAVSTSHCSNKFFTTTVHTLPHQRYRSYLQVESIFFICQDTPRDKQDIFFLSGNLIAYVLLLCDCTSNSGQHWLQK